MANLRFYFMGADLYDSYLKRHAAVIDNEVSITDVEQMVSYVVKKVATSDEGLIRSIVFASHGSHAHFYIGDEMITQQDLEKFKPRLLFLTPLFHPEACVFVSACNSGENPLLHRLSKLWGVKVIGWKGNVSVRNGVFGDYLQYPKERVVCAMNRCRVKNRPHLANVPWGYY